MYKVDALTENLREITPYVELEGHVMKLTEDNAAEVLREADIVCEAFDRAEAKAMLVNAVLQQFKDKIVISGSGMAGFKSANLIQTKKVAKRLYIAGDEVSDVNDGIGLVASRVMVCAAHEAHMVLRLLSGEESV